MTLAVLCPGQGAQHAGMLDLIVTEAAQAVRDAGEVAGFDLSAVLHGDAMFANAVAQPLICASQCLLWSLLAPRLAEAGIEAALFAGYSIGELAAYGCAGGLALDTVIPLARRRAQVMDAASAPDDGLVAVRGLGRRTVETLCAAHGTSIAIVNGDDHCIVGGHGGALRALARDAESGGGLVQSLPVRVAAHTPLLAAAAIAFHDDLSAVTWRSFKPVLAGVDGSLVRHPAGAIEMLSRQLAGTLHWSSCMDSLIERGVTVCIELGPGNALARMINDRHPALAARSVADFRSLDAVVDWVSRSGGQEPIGPGKALSPRRRPGPN